MDETARDQFYTKESAAQRRLLLLDTCGREGSLALAAEREGIWMVERTVALPEKSASQRLIPELRDLLLQMEWEMGSLEAIAVVNGPGSFTGVRVGLSAAKGLCEGLTIPLIAISRLAVLAGRVTCGGMVHAVLDAGRGDVYRGRSLDGRMLGEEMRPVEGLPAAVGRDVVVVCEDHLVEALAPLSLTRVDPLQASDGLGIAVQRLDLRTFDDPSTVDGNYLRRTEVEIHRRMLEQEQARAGRIHA